MSDEEFDVLDSLVNTDENEDSDEDEENDDVPFDTEEINDETVEDNVEEVTDEKIVDLRKERFGTFMDLLRVLKESCTDLIINEGKIQQLSNQKECIYSVDFSKIVGKNTLLLSGVAKKHDLLEIFRKQNVDMFLEINDMNYIFRDSITKLEFMIPMEEYLENRFIKDEVVSKKTISDDDEKILEYEITKMLLDRMNNSSKLLKASVLRVEFDEGKANLVINAGDSSSTTKISLATIEDKVEDTDIKGYMNFSMNIFMSFINGGVENLTLEFFKKDDTDNRYILRIKGELAISEEEDKIPVIAWIPTKLDTEKTKRS
jgi:hypothetical protein